MASPQLENGYTRIANELLEALYNLRLSQSKFRIVLFIIRHTYGYGHKEHEMSLGFIGKALGMLKQNVYVDLTDLEAMKVIIIQKKSGAQPQIISINKNYSDWGYPNREQLSKQITVIQTDNPTVIQMDNPTVIQMDNQNKKDIKKDIKKEYIDHVPDFFEHLWAEYPNKKNKKGISKDAYREIKKAGEPLLLKAITNYKEYIAKNDWYSPMNGSTFFNGRWRDYIDNEQSEAKEEKTEKQIQYTADGVMIE